MPHSSPPTDAALREIRAADATVTVTVNGAPWAEREVVVRQLDHRFRFGCIGFELIPYASGQSATEIEAQFADLWLGLFNTATLPFYWGLFEKVRGEPDTDRRRRAAQWFVDQGCTVKGHPLAWHTLAPPWLLELSYEEIARAQRERILREMRDFAGVIDAWDVINEVVIMPIFEQEANGITNLCRHLGRIPMIRMVFDAAREANPHATLLLNDFDMSAAYECLIEGVLEAGIQIDALGLQSHMHQGYWGEEKTQAILDRFSRYGLPLHFTETTLVSGEPMPPEIVDLNDFQVERWPSTPEGEQRQADEVVRHYRTLLAHPSVESITYWGMIDDAWLNAPGGFVRTDATPKPSYQALHSLIKGEWWLKPTTLVTDSQGRVRLNGFLGDYRLTAADSTATFTLDQPGQQALELSF